MYSKPADVVALGVVGVLAERLAVLLGDLAALGGLLDRQADPTALQVDVDDLHPQLLAGGDDLLGQVDVVRRHLRDVDEALDAVADLDEGAEGHELGDPAVDELADVVRARELLPGVGLGRLEREADALLVEVDVEDLDGAPRRRPATTEEGWSTCFQESSETWTRPSIPPRSTKAPKLTTEETTPLRISPGFRLTRNSPRCSFWVSSSHARRDSTTLLRFLSSSMILASRTLADVGLEVADPAQLDERGGQEAAQADVEDQAALDDLDDRALDDAAGLLDLLDRRPTPARTGRASSRGSAGPPCPPSAGRAPRPRRRRRRSRAASTSWRIESSRAGMTPSDL